MNKVRFSNMKSNNIREIMRERGVTVEQIAGKIGITEQAVYAIVSGKTTRATARFSFACALGMRVEELWPDTDSEQAAA